MQRFLATRSNDMLTLCENVRLSTTLNETLDTAEIIVISVNSQGLRDLMKQVADFDVSGKTIVLCMKGIEIETGKRLTEVVREYVDDSTAVAVWLGPGHVQEFCRNKPNCMVIDSQCPETIELLISQFSSDLIRFYYGNDLIGNEIGAAAKNVIGIAAGMLDGLDMSSLKGALMSR